MNTCLSSSQSSYVDRRRRRAGASEMKEDIAVENEDGSRTPPVPHTSGVGVSTRRTASVMVGGAVGCGQRDAGMSAAEVIFSLSFHQGCSVCGRENPVTESSRSSRTPQAPATQQTSSQKPRLSLSVQFVPASPAAAASSGPAGGCRYGSSRGGHPIIRRAERRAGRGESRGSLQRRARPQRRQPERSCPGWRQSRAELHQSSKLALPQN